MVKETKENQNIWRKRNSLVKKPELRSVTTINSQRLELLSTPNMKTDLPIQAKMIFGCAHCEWKHLGLCPYKLKAKETIKNNICDQRLHYLKNTYSGEKTKPKYEEWLESYNHFTLSQISVSDLETIQTIDEELTKLQIDVKTEIDSGTPMEELKAEYEELTRLSKIKAAYEYRWMEINKTLIKSMQTKLSREQPKELHITNKTMSLVDMNNIMRGDYVDAEFTEVDEE